MIELYEGEPKPRTKRVATNLTKNEYEVIRLRMDNIGIRKTATYLRLMALGEQQYPVLYVPSVNENLSKKLSATTSNLNQLVKRINEHRDAREVLRDAIEERETVSILLRDTIRFLLGRMDYLTMLRFATEMILREDLQAAIAERQKRGLP